jgi:4-amino-4-deoxy-L-arabinose transferase-like glycosyltransferase
LKRHVPRFLTVALMVLSFGLALTSAVQKSPTMDEQNHIARGAAYLGTGDPRLSIEHPPLVNALSALPAHVLLDLHLPLDTIWWEASEWYHFADLFLWETNPNAEQIVFLSRLPVIGMGLVLAALVFRWTSARFSLWGGLLAATFCALDPNVLAHERLSTTDIGGTLFAFLAAYVLWRTLRRPSLRRVLWAGLAIGLAFAAKLSALLFGPILALTVLLDGLPGGAGRARRLLSRAGLMLCAGLVGLLVVWAAYGFRAQPLEGGHLPVPALPYVQGVRAVLDFATGGRPGYLLGQVSTEGWWYYFPVAFAVKTPPATLVGLLIATGAALRRPSRDDLFILIPPLTFFLASTAARINLGYRHLLPMLPFMASHIGRLAPLASTSLSSASRVARYLPIALAVALALSTLSIYPHFLAYFNLIGGGPQNGWHILVDSNIDWGQDLKELRDWMEREGIDHVRLSWFGSARPEAYGISYDLLPGVPHGFFLHDDPAFNRRRPEPGIYVISVTNLVGAVFPDPDLFAWFRARPPDDRVGYSLFIYRVSTYED